jgi:hypothetical protein
MKSAAMLHMPVKTGEVLPFTAPDLLNEKQNPRYSTPFLWGNIWVY